MCLLACTKRACFVLKANNTVYSPSSTGNIRFWHKVTIQLNSGNGRTTALADAVQQGEGGISASQLSDLLPTVRVLLSPKAPTPTLYARPVLVAPAGS